MRPSSGGWRKFWISSEEPYDPNRPVVCFDESPCQLIGLVRDPLPMKSGARERLDSEYERGGVCWVFMSFEPLTGWRELASLSVE